MNTLLVVITAVIISFILHLLRKRSNKHFYKLHHDINNILAVIQAETEFTLKKDRSVKEYQATLGSNLEEIKRIAKLINNQNR